MKETKYPRIQIRLFIGLLIIISISSIISISYYRDIKKLNKVTTDIIEHPFIVSNSVRDINIYINTIHRSMRDIVFLDNKTRLNNSVDLVRKNEKLIDDNFKIVKEKFLGDLESVNDAYTAFINSKPIRDEVIDLIQNGNIDEARKTIKEKGNNHRMLLLQKTSKMIDFADKKAASFNQNSITILQSAKRNFLLIIFSTLLIEIVLFVWIFYSISNPINKMINRIKNAPGNKMIGSAKTTRNQLAVLDFAISQFENRERILEEKVNERTNELKETKNILNRSIEDATIGIVTINLDGELIKVNNAFCDFIGYTSEELINMKSNDFTKEEDKDKGADYVKKIIEGKIKGESLEKAYIRKSGEIIYGSVSTSLIKDKNGQPDSLFAQVKDITKQKQYEIELEEHKKGLESIIKERTTELDNKAERLEKSQKALTFLLEDVNESRIEMKDLNLELERANKELEAFSYSVSHDLRAPLRHINGYVDLLTNRFSDSIPEKAQHYLDTISDSAIQMGVLIDDLLQFSRTGRQELKRTNVEMNTIVQKVIKTINEQDCKNRNVKWINADLPSVFCDPSLLHMVWFNLVSNAVKFTKTKNEAVIEIGYKNNEKDFVFFVQDNGVGFNMKYASKLFGVFQRLHSNTEFEGTGIGLANIRRIISKHGGSTWAEAEPNKGATFYFSLPKK